MEQQEGLTVEKFFEAFRRQTGWKCEPGSFIYSELEKFALERLGSTQDIDQLVWNFRHSRGQLAMEQQEGLTVEKFVEAFRWQTGWKCEPGSRIYSELEKFALERLGSTRDIDELVWIFRISRGLLFVRPSV